MEKIIEQLEKLQRGRIDPQWDGDVMGMNVVSDFVSYSDNIDVDGDLYAEIRTTVEHRIAETLTAATGEDIWGRWCNEDIKANFSDIQKILDSI